MNLKLYILLIVFLSLNIWARPPVPPECKGMGTSPYTNSWNEKYSVGEVIFVAPHLLKADESAQGRIILVGKGGDGYGEVCVELKKKGKISLFKRLAYGDITREDPTHQEGAGGYKTTR